MDKFEKITEVLLSYARGAAPEMLPQVHFHFKHSPSDIPVEEAWELSVNLSAFEKQGQDLGISSTPGWSSQWKAAGLDRETCLDSILKQLTDFLTEALAKKMAEQESLETAMNLLSAESTVGELWQQNPQESALAEEAADENPPLIILSRG